MTNDKSELSNFSEYQEIILLMEKKELVINNAKPQNENNMGDFNYE